ncbi:MAG: flagellar hook-basal body complex protein FliE [Pseudomonadota bacterium]|nr:flagellar hook-basal body complex protein FliE [Pseudomonadota bacterium]
MTNFGFGAYNTLSPAQVSTPASTQAKPTADENPVAKGASEFKAAVQQAEQAAIDTAVSGADPHAMVEALANAEMVLDTAVTIRDKVVEAYQELLRMPV